MERGTREAIHTRMIEELRGMEGLEKNKQGGGTTRHRCETVPQQHQRGLHCEGGDHQRLNIPREELPCACVSLPGSSLDVLENGI